MRISKLVLIAITFVISLQTLKGQNFMENIPGRNKTSLNGQWKIIIDLYDRGMTDWTSIWKDRKPTGSTRCRKQDDALPGAAAEPAFYLRSFPYRS